MFIGHYAVGFAAKRARPDVSLGTLFLAAQFADLLWPVLVLTGVERLDIRPGATPVNPFVFVRYPYSHSLLALAGWGVLFALAYRIAKKAPLSSCVLLAAVVVSHWVLDFASHLPDMPIGFAGPFVGLGLWRSRAATIAVEVALFVAGIALYARATRARDRTGVVGLWSLVGFLLLMYSGSLAAPPPPNARAVAWGALAMVVLVFWAYRLDRHREVRPETVK